MLKAYIVGKKSMYQRMLRRNKQFGRCNVQGHGKRNFCELCAKIQSIAITRTREKNNFFRTIDNVTT
jgi:hypothetical protein